MLSTSIGPGYMQCSSDWLEIEQRRKTWRWRRSWRLYTHHPNQDNPRLGGWLYRVAINLGFNALRSRQRRQQYELLAMLDDLQDKPEWDPAEQVEKAQEILKVRQALLHLKPRSAQLLVLRYSGLSYAELAEALGIAPGSVGTPAGACRERIRRDLPAREGGSHAPHGRSHSSLPGQ